MDDDTTGEVALALGEAAARLHCSVRTVRRMVKQGRLDGFALASGGGRITRVTLRSVMLVAERAARRA